MRLTVVLGTITIVLVPYTNGLSSILNGIKGIQSQQQKPIRKVAIIGSGIAGLSLAHALENSDACARPYLDALSSDDGGTVSTDSTVSTVSTVSTSS